MATIKNAITMQDKMSPVFNSMIKAMNSTLSTLEKVNKASNTGVTGKAFQKAQKDINSATNAVTKFQSQLKKAQDTAKTPINIPIKIPSMGGGLGLLNLSAGMNIGKQIADTVKASTDYLDNLTLTKARLDLINDGMQTTVELQDKLLSSANRARMDYQDMAASVSKLNMLASDQFSTNEEAIAFVETLNKMFVVSGTGAQEAKAAMYQLTQAMAAGKLQGDEFRSIMENAPMLVDAIAKHLGKAKGELKELSSEGLITSDIIKGAMFQAIDEVNNKFDQMPITFGQKMQEVKNNMMAKMSDVSNMFSEWLNSENAEVFFNTLATGVTILASIALGALSLITNAIAFLKSAFEALEPVIIIAGVLLLAWALSLLPLAGTAIGILSLNIWGAIVAAWNWVIALIAVNWPILLIALAIGILMLILQQLGVTFDQVIGFIIGLLFSLVAIVYNCVIFLINPFIAFANFLRNVFIDPVGSIKMLFLDMAEFIVDKILWVAKALENLINLIPLVEVNISSGLEDMAAKIELKQAEVSSKTGVKETSFLEYKDIGSSFSSGYNAGSNFVNGFGDKSSGLQNYAIDTSKFSGMNGGIGGLGDDGKLNGGKIDEVGKIKGDVSITEEDIKLLKDIASTDFINSYTTLRPEMKVEFTGPINETVDVNKILEAIEEMTEEALSNVIIEEAS